MRPSGRAGTGGHMVPPHSRYELGIIHFEVKQGHTGGMLREETLHMVKGRKNGGQKEKVGLAEGLPSLKGGDQGTPLKRRCWVG